MATQNTQVASTNGASAPVNRVAETAKKLSVAERAAKRQEFLDKLEERSRDVSFTTPVTIKAAGIKCKLSGRTETNDRDGLLELAMQNAAVKYQRTEKGTIEEKGLSADEVMTATTDGAVIAEAIELFTGE